MGYHTEAWFIIFLIVELAIRWLLSIIQKHHALVVLSIYSLV
jgi:hypothetical protein